MANLTGSNFSFVESSSTELFANAATLFVLSGSLSVLFTGRPYYFVELGGSAYIVYVKRARDTGIAVTDPNAFYTWRTTDPEKQPTPTPVGSWTDVCTLERYVFNSNGT